MTDGRTGETILAICSDPASDAETIHFAMRTARGWGCALTLLGFAQLPGDLSRIAVALGRSVDEIKAFQIAAERDRLRGLAAAAGVGEETVIEIRIGKPFIEIIHAVQSLPVAAVIKTAEILGGMGRYLFASTDQHLLRKCPGPVWLRSPSQLDPPRRVLAAVDLEPEPSDPALQEALNRHILAMAARAAAEKGAIIDALFVWDAPEASLLRHWAGRDDPDRLARRYAEDIQRRHQAVLAALCEDATAEQAARGAIRFAPHLQQGQAREVIPRLMQEGDYDTLVMGTIARVGVPGLFIGNTAEDILNAIDCSVLTVKPPGFVSPIVPEAPTSAAGG